MYNDSLVTVLIKPVRSDGRENMAITTTHHNPKTILEMKLLIPGFYRRYLATINTHYKRYDLKFCNPPCYKDVWDN